MQPWQEKALAKGRTPLPESPGLRPWMNSDQEEARTDDNDSARVPARNEAGSSHRYATRATVAANNPEPATPAPAPAADPATASASGPPSSDQTVVRPVSQTSQTLLTRFQGTPSASYVFWRADDLRRLVRMRNGGAKWSAIAVSEPFCLPILSS